MNKGGRKRKGLEERGNKEEEEEMERILKVRKVKKIEEKKA